MKGGEMGYLKYRKGFTLIELMIVVIIIAALSAMV
ncbi:MAG: prepilin-type N-terminal cleavage/methylation domain-containing protein, partial [Candidatus Omnitrophica bacterium]|nr:prepilin-type N-terminal cleavage/methylation domain-containing protein [Candidatus Omnitrophota bacterium]